eukprot:g73776.t1
MSIHAHTDIQGSGPGGPGWQEKVTSTLRRSKRLSVEMESAESEGKADKPKVRTRSALQNITNQVREHIGGKTRTSKPTGAPNTGKATAKQGKNEDSGMIVEPAAESESARSAARSGTEPSPDAMKLPDMQSPKDHLPGFSRTSSTTQSMDQSPEDVEISEQKTETAPEALDRFMLATRPTAQKQIGGESFVLDTPIVEYLLDIDCALRDNELKYRPKPDYMTSVQNDINHTMRGILVAWLVEVAEEYNLSSQTLFLTVSYIDRLLSVVSVHRTKLQLIGITSMLIASKYEEIYPPSVDDFVYIADHTYTRDEVLRMETVILNTLKFALTNATAWEFVRRYTKLGGLEARTVALSHYLAEMFLQEPQHVSEIPSQVAAASCWIAHWAAHSTAWRDLQNVSGYSLDMIRPVVKMILTIYTASCSGRASLQAVRTKYTEEKWFRLFIRCIIHLCAMVPFGYDMHFFISPIWPLRKLESRASHVPGSVSPPTVHFQA